MGTGSQAKSIVGAKAWREEALGKSSTALAHQVDFYEITLSAVVLERTRKGFSSWNMRNILVLCCAFLLSFCVAIPLAIPLVSPVNFAKLVAIGNESPHMGNPHPAIGSLRDMKSNAYDGRDERVMLHDARDCFFSTNAQDDVENNRKLGQGVHCVNSSSKRRTLSRRHNGSVHKGHKGHKAYGAGASSKSAVVSANGPHWSHQAEYRRSPMLGLLGGIEHPRLTSTSTEDPHMEPTQAPSTASHHTDNMTGKPTNSQGSDGSHPDEWGAYRDWKQ